jgi:hypothetical protein
MRNGEADSAQAHQRINASSGILAAQRMGCDAPHLRLDVLGGKVLRVS